MTNDQWFRATDTYYTKDRVLLFPQTIYDNSGRQVDLDPADYYYDINFKALSKYITIFSDPKNFILENPEGAVYVLDPASNVRLTSSAPSEPQPLHQPVSGEIPIRTPEELAKIGHDSNYSLGGNNRYNDTGGLVGLNDHGTITSSYWDVQTSGIATSAGGTGKTTAEMKQQSTFAGWDFTTVWAIDEGKSYPYLRSNEQIPHPGTIQ